MAFDIIDFVNLIMISQVIAGVILIFYIIWLYRQTRRKTDDV